MTEPEKDDDAAKKGEEQEERGDTNATSPVGASDVPAKSQNPAVVAVETPEVKGKKDEGEEESPLPPCPLPRINPCLTVRGNTLYVYGGILEVREHVFPSWRRCGLPEALILIQLELKSLSRSKITPFIISAYRLCCAQNPRPSTRNGCSSDKHRFCR